MVMHAAPAELGRAVPVAGPDVCRRCHGPTTRPGECWCCRRVGRLLGGRDPDVPVVPLAVCRPGDAWHGVLRRYKDAGAVAARAHFSAVLRARLDRFLTDHGSCLRAAAGGWEALAVVPTTARGAGRGVAHPLVAVVRDSALGAAPTLAMGPGGTSAAHLRPSPAAFAVPRVGPSAPARRVLVVDDTWVTGARARSAAAALAGAGHVVTGVLVLGLAVDPAAAPRVARWWGGRPAAERRRCCLPGCSP